jgi:hypothetical protein
MSSFSLRSKDGSSLVHLLYQVAKAVDLVSDMMSTNGMLMLEIVVGNGRIC